MFRKFNTIVASLVALVASTVAFGQVQFIDVDPGNEGIVLGGNWYNSGTNHLIVPGIDLYGGQNTKSSWVYDIDLNTGSWTRTLIPSAITGGDVIAVGISRDGANVFGWMDSPGSDPLGTGEGFFSSAASPENRTLVGFLPQGARESRIRDMSANGVAVGDATGGTTAFTWTGATGIQQLPVSFGTSAARTVTSSGTRIGGIFADDGPGSEGAGTWQWDGGQWNTHALNPIEGSSIVLSGSSDAIYLGGSRGFNASAWINGAYQEILLDGIALTGEVRAVTDDGFFVGIGDFYGESRGFVWHEGWSEAMTARDYVMWSQGFDIGHDILELNGAFSYGGNLYLTGYGSGAALQTPAVVPEPRTLSLLGTGAATLFGRRRRA